MDEVLLAAAVERVGEAAVAAHDARYRKAADLLVGLARIDDVAGRQPAGSRVECPHAVVEHVLAGVLDQVEPASVWRDRVDREEAGQRDMAPDDQPSGVENGERRARGREVPLRSASASTRPSADRPVVAPPIVTGETLQRPSIWRERRTRRSPRRTALTTVSSPACRVTRRSLPPGATAPALPVADDGSGGPAALAAVAGAHVAQRRANRRSRRQRAVMLRLHLAVARGFPA